VSGTRTRLAAAVAACCLGPAAGILAQQVEDCTVLGATVAPAAVPAGSFFKVTYRWQSARPLGDAYTVFVHLRDVHPPRR
jgi:hypothetical protein